MEKTTIHITGMHCRSCEILIEDELLKIPGIKKCAVNHTKGIAEIYHNNALNEKEVTEAISEAGYSIGKDEKPLLSKNLYDYIDIVVAAGILFIVYTIANTLGLFNLITVASNDYSSLPVVLLIGITAGFSTCMALVGGLVLGASAKFAEKHPTATSIQKFKPHIFFNIGRIASYFFFGSIIGFAGSFFSLSPTVLGILTIIVGGVMFLLGAQLIDISPRLRTVNITLPKFISRTLGIKEHTGKEYSHTNSMILGGATFFLPCGFTQAMQLYAISTGNSLEGALTMGIFAIGTAPGLLGIGGLTSVIKGEFAKSFFKFAGIIVIILATFNISNGINLSGLAFASPFSAGTPINSSDPNVSLENGIQVVRMTQNSSGYFPNTFTIKKGVPVRWIINSTDPYSCASSIISQKINVRKSLDSGENIIEFTPQETGIINFSCTMGMYRGTFNVVDEQGNGIPIQQKDYNNNQGSSCGSGGCGCGGETAAKKAQPNAQVTPVQPIQEGQVQVLKAEYSTREDIVPNEFSVKVGQPVRLEIYAKEDGYGCMGSVMIQKLAQKPEIFTKGETIVYNFTPQTKGRYLITCAMGVPRGAVTVN